MKVLCVSVLVLDILAVDLPKVADPGEEITSTKSIEVHLGGHAANISINLRNLGMRNGDVGIIGAVGDDVFGNLIEKELKKKSIVTYLQKIKGATTCKNMILVVKGEDRRFHTELCPVPEVNQVFSILEKETPEVFYAGTTGIMDGFDTKLKDIFRKAKELGCITFIDPVIPHHSWDYLHGVLKWVDIFHSNDIEAINFTKKDNIEEALNQILRKGVGMGIITLGNRGLLAANQEYKIRMPAFKVQAIDPTGAGDAFTSGLVYKILEIEREKLFNLRKLDKDQLLPLLIFGEAVGAACVMNVGTTAGIIRNKINKIFRNKAKKIFEKTDIKKMK